MPRPARRRRALMPILAAAMTWLPAGGADAAVRICQSLTAGEAVEASTAFDARRGAVQSWRHMAGGYGVGFTNFQLAWDRETSCAVTAAGTFRCQAVGRPCVLSQVPREDLMRLTRGPRGSAVDASAPPVHLAAG